MNRTRKRYILLGLLAALLALTISVFRWAYPPGHQHCIKMASFAFSSYAEENSGKFPESERGWGDALLKLGDTEDSDNWLPFITGVDDDGSYLFNALTQGTDVDEALCTRIYVQGLNEDSPFDTAILFDRDSEPGGDHFRCRFREPVREILTVGGAHKMINDRDWLEYVEKQRKLLRDQGFDKAQISEIYGQFQ